MIWKKKFFSKSCIVGFQALLIEHSWSTFQLSGNLVFHWPFTHSNRSPFCSSHITDSSISQFCYFYFSNDLGFRQSSSHDCFFLESTSIKECAWIFMFTNDAFVTEIQIGDNMVENYLWWSSINFEIQLYN